MYDQVQSTDTLRYMEERHLYALSASKPDGFATSCSLTTLVGRLGNIWYGPARNGA